MSQGVVTKHLIQLVAKQVADAGLVVWYDPEGHYRSLASSLNLPETTIAHYDGSFLQLRREIDPLLADLEPPRLVVYVPMDQGGTDHALIELEAAGVVMQPKGESPSRTTRLSLVAFNALRSLRSEAEAAEIEKQVEAGKLSLADLDSIGERKDSGVLSLIFGTGNPQEVALAFLASDRHDAEVQKKAAIEDLVGLFRSAFEVDLAATIPLPELQTRVAQHVLMTDLVACLGSAAPPRSPRPRSRPQVPHATPA